MANECVVSIVCGKTVKIRVSASAVKSGIAESVVFRPAMKRVPGDRAVTATAQSSEPATSVGGNSAAAMATGAAAQVMTQEPAKTVCCVTVAAFVPTEF